MVLVDTSVWIDHLRDANARLGGLLLDGQVAVHPFVIGEIALGTLKRRADILELLDQMPGVPVASDREVRALIERRGLMGQGIGLVDAHLLASAMISGFSLWTLDLRLAAAATRLRIV